jgi:zinc transport system substrate-binding protein
MLYYYNNFKPEGDPIVRQNVKVWAAAAAIALWSSGTAAAQAPEVIVTLKPVHSLVAGIMEGIGEPKLLITGSASEHGYSLKPSDAKALRQAKVVVRVSEAAGHDEDEADVHIWLDPANGRRIVAHMTDVLSEVDAANAARYRANGEKVVARLDALDAELAAAARPLAGKPYIVFHDAYQYFEDRYGLTPAGSITLSPERQPGAKRIAQVRDKVKELGATCVFAEPQFEPKLVNTVIQGTPAKSGVLDPLGADLAPGPDLYFQLMRNLARALGECLDRP